MFFAIISSFTILLSIFPLITRNFDNSYQINYSDRNYNSFSKLISIDKNGNYSTYLVDKVNVNGLNKCDAYNAVNNDKFWNYLIPGEWFCSLNSSLASNTLNFNNYLNEKYNYSLIKSFYSNKNYIYDNYYVINIRPNDINPFSLSNDEYENILISNIESISNDENNLNLKNNILVQTFLDKLKNTLLWNEMNLSFKEYNTISSLFGFNEKYSQLFYYWNYKNILANKTPNLLTKINNKYGKSLSDLLTYIYSTVDAYTNIYNFKVFGDVNQYYSNPFIINENYITNENDVNFIINNLIRFNQNSIFYLDINNNYQSTSISNLQNLSSNIMDYNSWKSFVLENTITYSKAIHLISNLKNILPNMYSLNLSPNYFDPYQYSYYFDQSINPYLNYNNLLLSLVILFTISINLFSIYKYNKITYKNMEL